MKARERNLGREPTRSWAGRPRVNRVAYLVVGWMLGIVVASPATAGRTWVVSNVDGRQCSDKGPASHEQPFCSIRRAVKKARRGDTVRVQGGIYGPTSLHIGYSGRAKKPIVIRAEPPRSAAIVGPNGAGEHAGPAVLITGFHVVFEGFEVRDSAGTGIRNLGNHVTIRDNYVHHNGTRCDPKRVSKCGQGIASNSGRTRGVVIERNIAAFNGSGGRAMDHDFYLSGRGMVIRNNIAVGADDFGFHVYPDCDDCLVYNNVAYKNGRSGFLIGGDHRQRRYSTNVRIFNNISVENEQAGFAFYHPGDQPMTMRNNIAHRNLRGSLQIPEGYTRLDNLHLLEVDPLFVEPERLNFHLRPTSPAIDAGDPGLVPPDDIDGSARISGQRVDIGADESEEL